MKRIINYLLSILGFSGIITGCDTSTEEYGCPYAEFIFKGRVTNSEGLPVENVSVIFKESPYTSEEYKTQTNVNGEYMIDETIYCYHLMDACLIAEGQKNDTVIIRREDLNFIKTPKDKDKSWYDGKAEETINFQLKD